MFKSLFNLYEPTIEVLKIKYQRAPTLQYGIKLIYIFIKT